MREGVRSKGEQERVRESNCGTGVWGQWEVDRGKDRKKESRGRYWGMVDAVSEGKGGHLLSHTSGHGAAGEGPVGGGAGGGRGGAGGGSPADASPLRKRKGQAEWR